VLDKFLTFAGRTLLRYARIAGVYVDVLIDDELDLPEHLPYKPEDELMMNQQRAGRSVKLKR
jgi:hypothetical protein